MPRRNAAVSLVAPSVVAIIAIVAACDAPLPNFQPEFVDANLEFAVWSITEQVP
jgi:hypothetical protein